MAGERHTQTLVPNANAYFSNAPTASLCVLSRVSASNVINANTFLSNGGKGGPFSDANTSSSNADPSFYSPAAWERGTQDRGRCQQERVNHFSRERWLLKAV